MFGHLLCISSTQTLPIDSTSNFFVLVSQINPRDERSGNRDKDQHAYCTYYLNFVLRMIVAISYIDSPHTVHMVLSNDPRLPQTKNSINLQILLSLTMSMMSISTIKQPNWRMLILFAQTRNALVYLNQSFSLGSWTLDSRAFDQVSNNKDIFSSLITTSALLIVTLVNGS